MLATPTPQMNPLLPTPEYEPTLSMRPPLSELTLSTCDPNLRCCNDLVFLSRSLRFYSAHPFLATRMRCTNRWGRLMTNETAAVAHNSPDHHSNNAIQPRPFLWLYKDYMIVQFYLNFVYNNL